MHGRLFVPAHLTARRAQKGLTMTALAALSGVSYHYLWRLEAGKHPRPSDLSITKLARALDCSADDLSVLKPVQGQAA